MMPRYWATTAAAPEAGLRPKKMPRKTPPSTRLVTGSSWPAVRGSSSISDTPPKTKSVMLCTGNPCLVATSEWASS